MRLISQSKWADVSYEMCNVCIEYKGDCIYGLYAIPFSGRKKISLGTYYSFDDAQEEMSRIVTAYCAGEKSYLVR